MINKLASVMDNSLKSFREDLKQEFATTSQLTQTLSQLRTDIKVTFLAKLAILQTGYHILKIHYNQFALLQQFRT
jgi:hypothetical protein